MRRVLLLTLGFVCLASGCGQSAKPPIKVDSVSGKAAGETSPATVDDLVIGEPVRHANLAIFPISSRTARSADRFITLDAGLKAGTVEVMELGAQPATAAVQGRALPAQQASRPADDPFASPSPPFEKPFESPDATPNLAANAQPAVAANPNVEAAMSGPDVNRLLVLNRSEKPLYLMPGEIIVGGQQDRTVAHEYVIAPADKPVPIDVFCVEHGRWSNRDAAETATLFSSANAPVSLSDSVSVAGGNTAGVAAKAAEGKFVGSVGNVSKRARMAVQGQKDQGEVWSSVAATNRASGASSSSGAFTANYADAETLRQLEPYVAAVSRPIADRPQIVGVLVAVNGRVETLDVFESTPLFRQLWPKLLKSYALDAANAPDEDAAKTCSIDDARQFLAKARSAQVASTDADEGLVTSTRDSASVVCFSAHDKSSPMAGAAGGVGGMGGGMGGGGGSFGGAVHTSGFAK